MNRPRPSQSYLDTLQSLAPRPGTITVIDPNDDFSAMQVGPIGPVTPPDPVQTTGGDALGEAVGAAKTDRFADLQAKEQAAADAAGNRTVQDQIGGMIAGAPAKSYPEVAGYKEIHDPGQMVPRRVAVDKNGNEIPYPSIFSGSPMNPTPAQEAARVAPKTREPTSITREHPEDMPRREPISMTRERPEDEAKFKDSPGKSGGAGAGKGGAGGSSSMSMRATLPGAAPPGTNWDSPFFTAAGALRAKGLAQGELARLEGEAAKQRGAIDEKTMADQARIQRQYEDFSAAHTERLAQLNRDVEEGKINPDHWWSSKNTGQQIMFSIAAAIGGFSAGFRGTGHNEVLDMMQHEIDRDIDAQKTSLMQKGKAAEGERGLLAEAYHRTHNLQEAVLLAKSAAYEHVGNVLAEQGAKAKETMGYADANLTEAAWDEKRREQEEKAAEFQQEMATKLQISMNHRAKGGGGAPSLEKRFQKYAAVLARMKTPQLREALTAYKQAIINNDGAGVARWKSWMEDKLPTLSNLFLSESGKETRQLGKAAAGEAAVSMSRLSPTSLAQVNILRNGNPEEVLAAINGLEHKAATLDMNAAAQAGLSPDEVAMYNMVYGGGGGDEEASKKEEQIDTFTPVSGGEEEEQ